MLKLAVTLGLSILSSIAAAASDDNIMAVYWGQNSNRDQGTLASYCEKDEVDMVFLAFLTEFPNPLQLNFANMCGDTFPGGLLHCSQIGKDIKTCQEKGKKVILSIGGAISNYQFESADQAKGFAETMWNKFGEGMDTQRPFDSAIVDGFDFDLEGQNTQFTDVFALALKEQTMKGNKKYLFTSAPQCFLPDLANGRIIDTVPLDYIFIQFYNNWCNIGPNFNFQEWVQFMSQRPGKDAKLIVGLPGSPKAAGSGYAPVDTVKKYVDADLMKSDKFAGFGLWDASAAYGNVNDNGVTYIKELNDYLHGN